MADKRNIRKIILKSEITLLEEEDFNEQDEIYHSEFNKEFAAEMAYLMEQKELDEEEKEEAEIEEAELQVENEFLKGLHRELARLLHPDLNAHASDDDFKKMQSAYEEGDAATLIMLANTYNINFDLDETKIEKIEEKLQQKQERMNKKRNTCRWVWCSSENKTEVLRQQIRSSFGIDEQAFQEWLKKNSDIS